MHVAARLYNALCFYSVTFWVLCLWPIVGFLSLSLTHGLGLSRAERDTTKLSSVYVERPGVNN